MNFYEPYQAAISFRDAFLGELGDTNKTGFDHFGCTELIGEEQEEESVEDAGKDWEVYQALINPPLAAWKVFENHIKINQHKRGEFFYELVDFYGNGLVSNENLTVILETEDFEMITGNQPLCYL